jgi:hypothetical protein
MSLQSRVLKEYRQQYPLHTLREISALTGIQLTRVFRLMNGAAMKLEEFEQFSEAIGEKARIHFQGGAFQLSAQAAQNLLNENELSKLSALIERHIQWHKLIHGASTKIAADQHIA